MSTSPLVAILDGLFAAFAIGGLAAGWYVYARYPWERVARESRVRLAPGTVEATRIGATVGVLMLSVAVVGKWADFRATMVGLRTRAGAEGATTLSERVALVLPGELVTTAGLAVAALAVAVPLALVVRDAVLAPPDGPEE